MLKRMLGIVVLLSAFALIAGCSDDTPSPSDSSPKRLSRPSTVHVKFEPANLRREPGLSETIVAQVGPSTDLKVGMETDLWLQVETPSGQRGWIMKTWVSEDMRQKQDKNIAGHSKDIPMPSDHSPKKFSQSGTVHVKFEPANLRKEPDLSEAIVAQVGPSTDLTVGMETDLWLQVETPSGQRGWIMKTWVSEDTRQKQEDTRQKQEHMRQKQEDMRQKQEDMRQEQEENTGYGCWGRSQ
jgi:SH3-like domain-containing protein